MDQIFERLERLVKAWVNAGVSNAPSYDRVGTRQHSGDPDLDAAMAELDDFLDTSKTESEKRDAEEKRSRQSRTSWTGGAPADNTSAVVEEAYRYLGLKPYTPFAEVKGAYKKLLFRHHPDRNASSPEILRKSTETSTRINAAYQIIECYEESKKAQ